VLSLFLQFPEYQVLLQGQMWSRPFVEGSYMKLSGKMYSFDVEQSMQGAEMTVTEVKNDLPCGVQVLIDKRLGIHGNAGVACAISLNAVIQGDWQAVMNINDTKNRRGTGVLHINNVLDAKNWTQLSLGEDSTLLTNQPVLVHTGLALFLVYVLPAILCVAVIIAVLFFALRVKQ
jgi:hypothetical protein